MGKDLPRIAIVGVGPIGLEAALYARTLNYPVRVFERGQAGEYWQRWGHVRLFSPFGMNSTPLGRAAILAAQPGHEFPADDACIMGREHRDRYLLPLSRVSALKDSVHTETAVLAIGRLGLLKEDEPGDPRRARQPFRLLVRDGKNRERLEEADVVLDCSGTYGQHRWLGDGGIPAAGETAAAPHIVYNLEDVAGERTNTYAGKTVLVVGDGYSAATSVCSLASLATDHPATWVIWLARCQSTQPIRRLANDPLRERDRLAVRANNLATRGDGNVEFHAQSVVDAVEFVGPDKGFRVGARCAGRVRTFEADRIIANVGYEPDTGLYRELHVPDFQAALGLRQPEPDFYVLGAKSYGRDSSFLLRDGFEQIREVFTLISGDVRLDQYRQKN
jgi:thioredoxin reductase